MKKFLEVAKKIKGDYLVSSYFISNMFYSTVSPTIQVAYMQGMSSKMLSLMMIISCLTGTIIPVLWDNNKEKLYNKFGILCRLETIFYTAVLLAILLSLITPKGWYILDSLYGAFVTTNLRIAAKIMQAKRYDTEEKRIDFDMISVFNTDQELETIFLEHKRGEEAAKKESGKGLGMFLVQKLMEINGFSIYMKKLPDKEIFYNNIKYCRNLIVIDIPQKFIK